MISAKFIGYKIILKRLSKNTKIQEKVEANITNKHFFRESFSLPVVNIPQGSLKQKKKMYS